MTTHRRNLLIMATGFAICLSLLAWWLLPTSELKLPEIRLKRISSSHIQSPELNLTLASLITTQYWRVSFSIHNPGKQTLNYNNFGIESVHYDLEDQGSIIQGMRPMELLKPNETVDLLTARVSPYTRSCRIFIIYWSEPSQDRWYRLSTNWGWDQRFPVICNWIAKHLSHAVNEQELNQEVKFPPDSEVKPD